MIENYLNHKLIPSLSCSNNTRLKLLINVFINTKPSDECWKRPLNETEFSVLSTNKIEFMSKFNKKFQN